MESAATSADIANSAMSAPPAREGAERIFINAIHLSVNALAEYYFIL